jgi:DNA-binding NarL/FixJ family response regulator
MTPNPSSIAAAHEPSRVVSPAIALLPLSFPPRRLALRAAAVAADAAAVSELDAAELWRDLVGGGHHIVEELFTGESCYLVLARARAGDAGGVAAKRLHILELVLAGTPQNSVAIDLQLAASTVATHCRQGLQALGALDRPSRAHPLLMLSAIAATEPSIARVRASEIVVDEQRLRVVAMRRPDLRLTELLPKGELAVLRRLVEGHSYAEIGAERRTSVRTIANQITAVFRRLNVSGRNELVRSLLLEEGLLRLLPKPSEGAARLRLTGPRTAPTAGASADRSGCYPVAVVGEGGPRPRSQALS